MAADEIRTSEGEFPEFFLEYAETGGELELVDGGLQPPAEFDESLEGEESHFADPEEPWSHVSSQGPGYEDQDGLPSILDDPELPEKLTGAVKEESSNGFSPPDEAWRVEHIAWYRPWHAGRGGWGIYFREDRLLSWTRYISSRLLAGNRSSGMPVSSRAFDWRWLIPFSMTSVMIHEREHFRQEIAGTILEHLLQKPLFLDYLRSRRDRPVKHSAVKHSIPFIDEALANWSELEGTRPLIRKILDWPERDWRVADPRLRRALAEDFFSVVRDSCLSPGLGTGYGDFEICRTRDGLDEARAAFATLVSDDSPRIRMGRWLGLGDSVSQQAFQQVPKYWIGSRELAEALGFDFVREPRATKPGGARRSHIVPDSAVVCHHCNGTGTCPRNPDGHLVLYMLTMRPDGVGRLPNCCEGWTSGRCSFCDGRGWTEVSK